MPEDPEASGRGALVSEVSQLFHSHVVCKGGIPLMSASIAIASGSVSIAFAFPFPLPFAVGFVLLSPYPSCSAGGLFSESSPVTFGVRAMAASSICNAFRSTTDGSA